MNKRVKYFMLLLLFIYSPNGISSSLFGKEPKEISLLNQIHEETAPDFHSIFPCFREASSRLNPSILNSEHDIIEEYLDEISPEEGKDFVLQGSKITKDAQRPTLKTGTTIAGVVFSNGVVLGADTRATGGEIVRDTNCAKIHQLSDKVWVCGAGTSADVDFCVRKTVTELEFIERQNGPDGPSLRVAAAHSLLKRRLLGANGQLSVALVLGGHDPTGAYLYQMSVDGASDKVQYTALGSGCLAATAVLEGGFRSDLNEEEARQLVRNAILAGISNDLGSGSNIDICIITSAKVEYLRNYVKEPAGKSAATNMSDHKYSKLITQGRIKSSKKTTSEFVQTTTMDKKYSSNDQLTRDDRILQALLEVPPEQSRDEVEVW